MIIYTNNKNNNQKSWKQADLKRKQKKSHCDDWSQSTQITSALLAQLPHTGLWHLKCPKSCSVCSSFGPALPLCPCLLLFFYHKKKIHTYTHTHKCLIKGPARPGLRIVVGNIELRSGSGSGSGRESKLYSGCRHSSSAFPATQSESHHFCIFVLNSFACFFTEGATSVFVCPWCQPGYIIQLYNN